MKKLLWLGMALLGFQTLSQSVLAEERTDRAIFERITVKASVDDVWRAWTTTEGIKTFFDDRDIGDQSARSWTTS